MADGLRDVLILFMMIAVYFLPYFLIFKLIKLSGGALGKIQGAVDGAGKWGRDKSGLKGFRDRAQESANTERQNKARKKLKTAETNLETGTGIGAVNRFRRAKARSTLGISGASGETSRRLTDEAFDKSIQAKGAELKGFMRDFNPDQQSVFLERLNNAALGDTLDFGGKSIKVDEGLKAAAIPTMMDFKINPDNTYQQAHNAGGYYQAAVRRVMADNGGTVDQKLTDISRSGEPITDYVNGAGASTAIRTKQTTSYADLDDSRKERVRNAIATLSQGSEAQQAEAVGLMNMLARNNSLSQADHAALNTTLRPHLGNDFDFGAVANSGGNQRFSIDGGVISAVPTSTQARSRSSNEVVVDLQNTLRTATGGTGNISAAPSHQLVELYNSTANSRIPVEVQTHADISAEIVNRANNASALGGHELRDLMAATATSNDPNIVNARNDIGVEIVNRANNASALHVDQLSQLYSATANSTTPALQHAHTAISAEIATRGNTGTAVSLSDIRSIVSGAVGPDGSRGIQHLSDDDLIMVLSHTRGSTDTATQSYYNAADQELIRRGSQ